MPDGSFTSTPPEPETATQKDQRDVSTISFPYADLETAIETAGSILKEGAVPLSRDQLAGAMGQKAGSGNFSVKVGAARMFRLIETVAGKYQLTRLGFDILDSDEARVRAAMARAFLSVPLYRRAYDEFRNGQLPPRPHGLENAFVSFGVAPKQKDKARRAFENSARLAGFFEHGADKLVEPVIALAVGHARLREDERAEAVVKNAAERGDTKIPSSENDLIKGLFKALPQHVGDKWSHVDRYNWLALARQCFDMIYKPGDEGVGEIKITTTWRGSKTK